MDETTPLPIAESTLGAQDLVTDNLRTVQRIGAWLRQNSASDRPGRACSARLIQQRYQSVFVYRQCRNVFSLEAGEAR